MGVFDRQIATAKRLVAKNGQVCEWHSVAASGGVPGKPAGATDVARPGIPLAFFPLEREYLATFLSMLKDSEIPSGLVLGLMGQVEFTPQLTDYVIRGTERYTIHPKNGIEVIDPNGEGVILYLIRFARG